MVYNYILDTKLNIFKGDFMKTEVIMERALFGMSISQKSLSEFFSATDLVKAGNKWRALNGLESFNINEYFRLNGTIEFMATLEKKYGEIKIIRKGRAKHTWVHPILFIDIALAISPSLKIEVYEWLFDSLIKFRNFSGDSYKKMSGYLFTNTKNKALFYREIQEIAEKIKLACNVNNWEQCTEEQLRFRDKIHNNIMLLSDILRDNNEAVRLGIIKAKEF